MMARTQRGKSFTATPRAHRRRMRHLQPWLGWWIDLKDPKIRGQLRKTHPPLIGKAHALQRRQEWRRHRLAVKRAIQAERPLPRFRGDWAD